MARRREGSQEERRVCRQLEHFYNPHFEGMCAPINRGLIAYKAAANCPSSLRSHWCEGKWKWILRWNSPRQIVV